MTSKTSINQLGGNIDLKVTDGGVYVEDANGRFQLQNGVNSATVTTSSYTLSLTDRAVEVDYAGKCTLTIPTALITKTPEVEIIISDVSGAAGLNHINIVGEGAEPFSGDVEGVSIRVNYGSVTLKTAIDKIIIKGGAF